MIIRSVLCCAAMLAFALTAWATETPAKKTAAEKSARKAATKTPAAKAAAKPPPKTPPKATRKPAFKPAPKPGAKPPSKAMKVAYKPAYKPVFKPVPMPAARGKTETLTCSEGTEDRHARIGVVLVGGKVDSFAYYSKWKPRTCSIHLQRYRDPRSRWTDKGSVTNVDFARGLFVIEHGKGTYRFVFRDIDRERYCGMDGTINGTLTIRKGSEVCELAGIMEEGTPLGQAYAYAEPAEPAAAAPGGAPPEAPPPRRVAQRAREPESPFPTATVGVSD